MNVVFAITLLQVAYIGLKMPFKSKSETNLKGCRGLTFAKSPIDTPVVILGCYTARANVQKILFFNYSLIPLLGKANYI